MHRSITEGCLVSFEEKTFRVVAMFASGMITLKSLETEHCFDVSFTKVTLIEVDHKREEFFTSRRMVWLGLSDSNPKEISLATERFESIKAYLAGPVKRSDILEQLKISDSTLTRLLKKYDSELGPVSLVRSARGRKQGSRILQDIQEEIIKQAIMARQKNKKKLESFSSLYDYIDSKCSVMAVGTPSVNAVKSRLNSLGTRAVYSLLHGREAMTQKYDLKPGMIDVETILTMVQIDHTKVDLIICDAEGRPLMRPWLTVIIELKSRVILGYYLALHPPSAVSVAMAFLSACFPKQDLPITLGGGEDTRHRFWGKPEAVGADNAAEFTSDAFEATLNFYKISLLLRPIGKKHYGGHVERIIGTMMGKVHMLPGTTYSNALSKADYDSAKNSALTFTQFCKWFADQVAIYHGRAHEGLNRKAPYEVWDIEMAKKGPGYVPELPGDFKTFALDFFPMIPRTVQPKGVEFNCAYYSSTVLYSLVGKRLMFKYNPLNLCKIWLRLDGRYYEIPYSDITKSAISFSEHWAFFRRRKRRAGALVDPDLHQLRLQSGEDVEQAVKDTKRLRQNIEKKATLAESLSFLSYDMQPTSETKPLSADQTRKKMGWER